MVAYTAFTITTTAWRTKFRKAANAADNKGATVAVDSLINYEAVKVAPHTQRLLAPFKLTPAVLQQREIRSWSLRLCPWLVPRRIHQGCNLPGIP